MTDFYIDAHTISHNGRILSYIPPSRDELVDLIPIMQETYLQMFSEHFPASHFEQMIHAWLAAQECCCDDFWEDM